MAVSKKRLKPSVAPCNKVCVCTKSCTTSSKSSVTSSLKSTVNPHTKLGRKSSGSSHGRPEGLSSENLGLVKREVERKRARTILKVLEEAAEQVPGHVSVDSLHKKIRRMWLYIRYLHFVNTVLSGKPLSGFSPVELELFQHSCFLTNQGKKYLKERMDPNSKGLKKDNIEKQGFSFVIRNMSEIQAKIENRKSEHRKSHIVSLGEQKSPCGKPKKAQIVKISAVAVGDLLSAKCSIDVQSQAKEIDDDNVEKKVLRFTVGYSKGKTKPIAVVKPTRKTDPQFCKTFLQKNKDNICFNRNDGFEPSEKKEDEGKQPILGNVLVENFGIRKDLLPYDWEKNPGFPLKDKNLWIPQVQYDVNDFTNTFPVTNLPAVDTPNEVQLLNGVSISSSYEPSSVRNPNLSSAYHITELKNATTNAIKNFADFLSSSLPDSGSVKQEKSDPLCHGLYGSNQPFAPSLFHSQQEAELNVDKLQNESWMLYPELSESSLPSAQPPFSSGHQCMYNTNNKNASVDQVLSMKMGQNSFNSGRLLRNERVMQNTEVGTD